MLQDRDYVRIDKKRFVPGGPRPPRHRLPDQLLRALCRIRLHRRSGEQLDEISGGRVDWKKVLRDFWEHFSAAIGGTKELTISGRDRRARRGARPHFFPSEADGGDPRLCPGCGAGRLGLKLGKFGAFIGCSNYPECRYTPPLGVEGGNGEAGRATAARARSASIPDSSLPVSLRKGPYGVYVQLGEGENGEEAKARLAAARRRGRPMSTSIRRAPPRPAARDRQPPGDRRDDHRRDRPLRPLSEARHGLQVAGRRRRRADHRPQSRRHPARRAEQGAPRHADTDAQPWARTRRRPADQALQGPLRPLCRPWRRQRDDPRCPRPKN